MTATARLAICGMFFAMLAGCAGDPVAPIATEPVSPALEVAPKFVATQVIPDSPAVQRRCDFQVVLPIDSGFVRGQNALSATGRATLSTEVVARLPSCRAVEVVNITGYADRLGPAQANQTLSERRADVVKTFLAQQGFSAQRINAIGAGSRDPVSSECPDDASHAALVHCLAVDRRVTIEVIGPAR